MSLKSDIIKWDGKSKDTIQDIYDRYQNTKAFVSRLIALVGDEPSQKGSTWLLKACVDSGHVFSRTESSVILSKMSVLCSWESKLHFLQALSAVEMDDEYKHDLEYFLRSALTDNNKFVRAWAYNGFYVFSKKYPEYQDEAQSFLEMAMRDEAPSVKARIRNLI